MDVEDDLRRVLRARAVPETVPDPVPGIHEGIRRRRRHQRLQVLAAASSVVVLALGASLALGAHVTADRRSPAQDGPAAQASSVPPGFRVADVSFSSPSTAWALGTAGCRLGTCTDLLESHDGGQSWVGRAGPQAPMPGPDGTLPTECSTRTCVSSVRFATTPGGDLVGYAFTPGLALSLDGGITWANQPVDGTVLALEASHDNVIRILSPQGACPCSGFTIQSSPLGSTTWTTVETATASRNAVGARLVRQGSRLALLLRGHTSGGASDARSDLLLSTDSGQSWTRHEDPCGPLAAAELDAIEVSLAPNGIVAALCQVRSAGATSVVVSTDAGRTFSRPRTVPQTATLLAAVGNALVVAVGDGSDGHRTLQRSADAGRHWTQVASQLSTVARGSLFLGFTSDQSGTWIGSDDRLLVRTLDGGVTWTDRPFR